MKTRVFNIKWMENWMVWLLFLGAVLFRLFLLFRYRFAVGFDECHYLCLAGSFFSRGVSGILHPYWPPLYPLLIALFKPVTGDLELAGRLLNVLSGSLLVVLIYRLAFFIFGKREAMLAALFVAFYPPLAFGATDVMTESLFSVFGIAGIFTGWKASEKTSSWLGFGAGILWGCCYLLRPEGIGFLLVYLVLISLGFVRHLKSNRSRAGKRVRIAVWACIGFLVVSAPYLGYLKKASGKWTLSLKGEANQQMAFAVYFNTAEVKDPLFHLTADHKCLPCDLIFDSGNIRELNKYQGGSARIVHIPWSNYAVKYITNFYRVVKYAVPHTLTTVLFILWAVGFFEKAYDRKRWRLMFFVCGTVLFFWFVLVPVFHVNDRYFIPLFPLCFIWVGRGCLVVASWVSANVASLFSRQSRMYRSRTALGKGITLSFILVFGFFPEMAKIVGIQKYDPDMWAPPVELKEAGLWLGTQSNRPPVLLTNNKAVNYYAGQYDLRKGGSFSYDSIESIVEYAQFREVEYVVFSSRYLAWFPNLKPLIESQNPDPGLERVYAKTDPVGIRTVIYRLIPEKQRAPIVNREDGAIGEKGSIHP